MFVRKHPTRQFCKISVLGVWSCKCSWESSPGIFYLFLWYFFPFGKSCVFLWNFEKALLDILMCSSTFCLSWKIYMCFCTIFGSPGSYELCLLLENSYIFLLHPNLLESLMCSRNLFKKDTPGKKEYIF